MGGKVVDGSTENREEEEEYRKGVDERVSECES